MYVYGDGGLELSKVDDAVLLDSDRLKSMKGYMNFKIRSPPFRNGEDLSLVMMVDGDITPLNFAKFIVETLEYMQSRPDVYDLCASVDELVLEKITYKLSHGIYWVHMRLM